MQFITDLHIHSKYSRATSGQMCLEELDRWADDKGILVMATGDFTHPLWFHEIKTKLDPAEPGLFKLKPEFKRPTIKGDYAKTRFLLSVEISSIYSKNEKVHRIHNLVFAPSMETAEKINARLGALGNIRSDGRPILGLDAERLLKIVLEIDSKAVVIPAHAWTPWFSLYGSMSGFDSMEECFGDYAKEIFAIETGLSSDPAMNSRLSALDDVALISNSDSHSLPKIGREANIFDAELSYEGIIEAIRSGAPNNYQKETGHKFISTVEFFPEEGKYHYDGHRNCEICFSPEETKKSKGICPKCGRPLTVGVMNRVDALADGKDRYETKGFLKEAPGRVPYYNLIPLDEIIAEVYGVGAGSKKAKDTYVELIKKFGSELKILLKTESSEIEAAGFSDVARGVSMMRTGKVEIRPGYDGEYGIVKIPRAEAEKKKEIKTLFS